MAVTPKHLQILAYRPQLKPIRTITDLMEEVQQTVWLDAIQHLSAADLGITTQLQANDLFVSRFKAVLVLQAQALHEAQTAWRKEFRITSVDQILDRFSTKALNLKVSLTSSNQEPAMAYQTEVADPLDEVFLLYSTIFLTTDTQMGPENLKKQKEDSEKLKE